MPQSLSNNLIHLIWSTKDRDPWLAPGIRSKVCSTRWATSSAVGVGRQRPFQNRNPLIINRFSGKSQQIGAKAEQFAPRSPQKTP
jgi:hypothetical protein